MYKLFVALCLIVAAFAEPAVIESGIPVIGTVVQQPGTVSVQKHTIESQHVHGIPASVSSQRQTIVQKSVSHVTPNVVGTETLIGTPSVVGSSTVFRTSPIVGTPATYGTPISRTTVVQSEPSVVRHL